MADTHPPRMRPDTDEIVPTLLVRIIFALLLAILALVTVAKLSGRPLEATAPDTAIIQQRAIYLSGDMSGAALVLDETGTVLAEFGSDKGGFVAGVERVLFRERTKYGVDPHGPVLLQLREGNRLSLTDPSTGWSAELMGFGADNTRSFARLLDQP